MPEDKNIIDDIFGDKMREYIPSEPAGDDSWNAIHVQVRRNLFYTFRLSYFNIYYLTGILLCAGLFLFWVNTKYSNNNNIIQPEQKNKASVNKNTDAPIENNTSTNPVINTKDKDDNNLTKENKKSTEANSTLKENNTSSNIKNEKAPVEEIKIVSIIKDSISTPLIIQTPKEVKTQPKKPVEKVILYKRDTVFTYDTVSVKKKKRK